MAESGEGLGLAAQTLARAITQGVGAQHLQRDLAIQLRVDGGVDDAHAAGAQILGHLVSTDNDRAGCGTEEASVNFGAEVLKLDAGGRGVW